MQNATMGICVHNKNLNIELAHCLVRSYQKHYRVRYSNMKKFSVLFYVKKRNMRYQKSIQRMNSEDIVISGLYS